MCFLKKRKQRTPKQYLSVPLRLKREIKKEEKGDTAEHALATMISSSTEAGETKTGGSFTQHEELGRGRNAVVYSVENEDGTRYAFKTPVISLPINKNVQEIVYSRRLNSEARAMINAEYVNQRLAAEISPKVLTPLAKLTIEGTEGILYRELPKNRCNLIQLITSLSMRQKLMINTDEIYSIICCVCLELNTLNDHGVYHLDCANNIDVFVERTNDGGIHHDFIIYDFGYSAARNGVSSAFKPWSNCNVHTSDSGQLAWMIYKYSVQQAQIYIFNRELCQNVVQHYHKLNNVMRQIEKKELLRDTPCIYTGKDGKSVECLYQATCKDGNEAYVRLKHGTRHRFLVSCSEFEVDVTNPQLPQWFPHIELPQFSSRNNFDEI